MDHVVYLDHKAKELENLLNGSKDMIIRGAQGRKLPHGRVNPGDTLYFLRNNGEGLVQASAVVKEVLHSDKLTPEQSIEMVENVSERLLLDKRMTKRFSGKRYLVFIQLKDIKPLSPFPIDRSSYGNMDDWLPVKHIESVTTK